MRNSDDFDAFYKATRERLLLQTVALTGDLPAARRAIRDAYVAAWHHWRKVSRLDHPEDYVRPLAWTRAQPSGVLPKSLQACSERRSVSQ